MGIKVAAWLGLGMLVSGAVADNRMILIYGASGTDESALRAVSEEGKPVPKGMRRIVVEGSRTLTAEHSLLAGERAYFLGFGGGFRFDGFKLSGGSVRFALAGRDSFLGKPAVDVTPPDMHASALQSVVYSAGQLRVDYTQSKAGRVDMDILDVNGRVLKGMRWVGESGRHSRHTAVAASRHQVLIVRWRAGDVSQLKKIVIR